jgi:hypothetical protein
MTAPLESNPSLCGQHLSRAVRAALVVPGAENAYGYATLTGTRENPEIQVHTFPDRKSMVLALSSTFNGRLLSDLYPDVFVFGPDEPIRLHAVIEEYPPVTGDELAQMAKDQRQQRARSRRFHELLRTAAELAASRGSEAES